MTKTHLILMYNHLSLYLSDFYHFLLYILLFLKEKFKTVEIREVMIDGYT